MNERSAADNSVSSTRRNVSLTVFGLSCRLAAVVTAMEPVSRSTSTV